MGVIVLTSIEDTFLIGDSILSESKSFNLIDSPDAISLLSCYYSSSAKFSISFCSKIFSNFTLS